MIIDTVATLYQKTSTKNSKGQVINTYALTKTLQVNLQPINKNPVTLSKWGIQDLGEGSRIMFYYPDDAVRILDRIKDAYSDYYEIRAVDKWGSPPFGHYEAILTPVQGEVAP